MNKALRMTAAMIAILGAVGMAQAQGSGGAGGSSGGSGTGSAGTGTGSAQGGTGSSTGGASPTSGSNNGMSSSKSGATANTGNAADTGSNGSKKPSMHPTKKKTKSNSPTPAASGAMGSGN